MLSYSKLLELFAVIRPLGKVAVGFSGGVDSSVVIAAAAQALGRKNVLAVTADSETLPARELAEATELASSLGIPHVVVHTREMDCPDFSDNPPERCYFCKQELWRHVRKEAARRGFGSIADGVNADDLKDHRPGIRASDEARVLHPLAMVQAGKREVRDLARQLNLPNWDKPAQACLSSRFPYGEKLTPSGLKRVEQSEEVLRELGIGQLRVRSHGDIARIEVPVDLLSELSGNGRREEIVVRLKEAGFRYVTLDLEGFRSGSMNEAPRREPSADSIPKKS